MSDSNGSSSLSLADLVDDLASRMQAGEAIDAEAVLLRHPEHASELPRLLPRRAGVGELSHSGGPAGGQPGGPLAGTLGDFRILREVGRGGMGVVYEAGQVSLGRRVALKVLPRDALQEDKALKRFRREARAAARPHHTNIVPVFEVGQAGDTCYYAMQFIAGQGLDLVIDELRRLRARSGVPAGGDSRGARREQELPAARQVNRLAQSLLSGQLELVGSEGIGCDS